MSESASRGSPGSRRRIREAVVQFLYAADSERDLPDEGDSAVLALLLEPLEERAILARAKAVLHLQQGRPHAARDLPDLLHRALAVEVVDDQSGLAQALRDLHDSEASVARELDHLRHELNGNKSVPPLAASLEAARESNIRSRAAAARLSSCAPVFPELVIIRKDALALWSHLAAECDRLEAALARRPGDQPELRAVARAEADLARVRDRIRACLDGLRAHLPEIDRQLAAVVANYAPERIDRVDRAILRLGAYELLYDPSIPPRVAIDEAIELARSFGTSESARFVNGILDRLPKPPALSSGNHHPRPLEG